MVEVVCFWMIFIHPSSFDETFHYFVIIRDLWYYISIGHQPETSLISQHNNFTMGWNNFWEKYLYFLEIFFSTLSLLFYKCFIQPKNIQDRTRQAKIDYDFLLIYIFCTSCEPEIVLLVLGIKTQNNCMLATCKNM